MRIVIVTPDGELYNEEVDAIVVSSGNNGEYGVLKDHVPIISTIDTGYIKLEQGNLIYYVVVINGVVENHDNLITVIAQDAFIGTSKEKAFKNLNEIRQERLAENRKRNVEFAKAERELKKQIKQTGAGDV
ncbi:MAG TPA: ATP synthase F1 subunit epsilon [Bacillota bacterium]|nr:ATP synthase F1 subunit epsilon [Bacillota bacterium]HPJ86258.1 ATP synthase F1 subunit epsilon [Bacillota bacterium]HPQ62311.1 ATP synthase F1 subunit epsilon [Bacillota bacterium]HRX91905.1 ATP synthase F1 subunit epsilon [Candidatus Izemoplasmatales bacterium]